MTAKPTGRGGDSLPRRVQRSLMRLYGVDAIPDVGPFVTASSEGGRERVLVQSSDDELAVSVELPPEALEPRMNLDAFCQLVEGVSHFVVLTSRAVGGRSTTQLELELQAEVDKYLILANATEPPDHAPPRDDLFARLFERASFADPIGSERGDRYRLAHRAAARLLYRWRGELVDRRRQIELRSELRRFFHLDTAGKLHMAQAA